MWSKTVRPVCPQVDSIAGGFANMSLHVIEHRVKKIESMVTKDCTFYFHTTLFFRIRRDKENSNARGILCSLLQTRVSRRNDTIVTSNCHRSSSEDGTRQILSCTRHRPTLCRPTNLFNIGRINVFSADTWSAEIKQHLNNRF